MAFVKYPNAKVLKAELAKKKLQRMYLFLGEEEGEKDKCIAEISSILFNKGNTAAESIGRFHCENGEIMEAAAFALSSSMFSNTKLCVLYNIDAIPAAKKNQPAILDEIVDGLPDGTTLITSAIKNMPPSSLSAASLKKFQVIQFWRYFDSDISAYIATNLRKHGFQTEDGVVNLIITNTGNDIRKIDEAIEILVNSSSGKTISRESVISVISDDAEVSIFEFSDALFQKDKRALFYYKKLRDSGMSEQKIFGEILRQVGLLEKYYLASETESITEAMDTCGIGKKYQDKFINFTRSFGREKIGALYALLMKADYERKSGKAQSVISDPLFNFINSAIFSDTLQ
jgi:DNA polymerase III delta subunit